MPSATKRIRLGSLVFDVNDEVYEPAEDSYLFVDNIHVKAGERVLDLGTGSGVLAVSAAKQGVDVVAIDINPHAVRAAKANAKLNGVCERIVFFQGDLFSALRQGVAFDVVLFNAPYLPSEAGEAETWIGRAWAGGADGRVVVDRFIEEVAAYLKLGGRVLLMQSTLTGVEQTIGKFQLHGFDAAVVASQNLLFFETLTLIEAKRPA
jgi:release factor glutamine methyltransferase